MPCSPLSSTSFVLRNFSLPAHLPDLGRNIAGLASMRRLTVATHTDDGDSAIAGKDGRPQLTFSFPYQALFSFVKFPKLYCDSRNSLGASISTP